MPDLDLSAVTAARRVLAEQHDRLRGVDVEIAAAAATRDAALAAGDRGRAEREAAAVQRLVTERRNLQARESDARSRVSELVEQLLERGRPEDAVTSLSAAHPVLMLPVRIETRFDGEQALRIRVFPDQVHVTSHDPALTEDEEKGLRWYWKHRWPHRVAGESPAADALADEAWQVLSGRLPPARAAFVVRAYPPENLDSGDDEPRWGELPRRAAAWSGAPRAALLPDRWAVVGFRRQAEGRHREIFRVWGRTVPDTLQVGPRPDPERPTTPRGLPQDEGLRWLHEPETADGVGMLVTVRQSDVVAGVRLADGVDRLVVVGVDRTLDPAQGAAAVQAHLAALAGEGDLAFVPQGVPTNSTADPGPGADRAVRSGFSTDPAAAREQLAPHRPRSPHPDDAAALTASALGVATAPLADVPGADLREQAWQGALVDALWPATAGYYLREMLDPLVDDERIEQALRDHAAAHLRASGPLPLLRVVDQPYGLLPVVPRTFRPTRGRRAQRDVHAVGGKLRTLVEEVVASVPRVAHVRSRADADDVLLRLLQRTPVAWSLDFRVLTGPAEFRYASQRISLLADLQHRVTATLLATMGWYPTVPMTQLAHDATPHGLDVPLVLRPEAGSATGHGTGYLSEILDVMSQPDARRLMDGRTDSVALLEAFLAYALVREYDIAARQTGRDAAPALDLSPEFVSYLGRTADRVPFTLRVEPTAVAPAAPGATVPVPSTPLELASTVVPQLTGAATLTEHVAGSFWQQVDRVQELLDLPDSPLHKLARFRTAVTTLTEAPPDQLEWAFRGVLDLYATRLDAWFTSLATARLAERRGRAPTGLHIGGWGVVEDLRRDTGPAADSAGFLHAPSLAQAVSLAVMRSGRMAHRTDAGEVFDLDLTSRRVREALRLLEGVNAGQRLAALLGYRLERALQERDLRLARWILPLRMQFPLRSERPDDAAVDEPVESVAARDVVDGVALLRRWERDRGSVLTGAGVASGDQAAVGEVLDAVAGLADAVSDVLVAEAVHQAATGNLERSGAALAAHDRQAPAPDPEFVRTPRDGAVVAHRVGLWLPAATGAPADGWAQDIRSVAEPRLDRWLGAVLGRPVRWRVDGSLPREPAVPVSVSLEALGVGALSLVLAARRPGSDRPSELELRAALALARRAESDGLEPGPDDAVDVDQASLAPVLDLARWAADVAGAPQLTPADLAGADDLSGGSSRTPGHYDVAEAVDRARRVRTAAGQAVVALESAVGAGDAAAVAAALLAVVPLDGPEAVSPPGDEDLLAHAVAVLDRLRPRLQAADALLAGIPGTSTGASARPDAEPAGLVAARGAVRALLGEQQPFLPLVQPDAPAPLAASLADRDALLTSDDTAPVTWLHTHSLVRPALDPLACLLAHAEADGADVAAQLRVVQAPHRPGARWVALPFERADTGVLLPPHGTVGLVVHAPSGMDPAQPAAGVVVDAWTETVPAAADTTAVTFHYDAPGARAPQTMLLGVHPDPAAERWDFDALLGCVTEAVDLARLRTVGAQELAPLSTFLPALFLPDTYTRDVPGVRLTELAAAAARAGVGGLVKDHVLGKAGGTGA